MSPDPSLIQSTRAALAEGTAATSSAAADEAEPVQYTPATTARKSLASPEHIISMIDGRSYRTLKRHLSTNGLTPDQYRARYNLPATYPMVAPTYSEARRETAKRLGLGRKRASQTEAVAAEPAKPGPKPRRRKEQAESSLAQG